MDEHQDDHLDELGSDDANAAEAAEAEVQDGDADTSVLDTERLPAPTNLHASYPELLDQLYK